MRHPCASRPTLGVIVLLLAAISPTAASAQARDLVGWRYWTAAEGLTEAYTTVLSSLPGGRIAARHGDVGSFDILDGFGVTAIPDPHLLGRIYEDSDGSLYTFNDQGVATYRAGSWNISQIPEIDAVSVLKKFVFRLWFTYPTRQIRERLDAVAAVPTAPGTLLILANGRILEWKRATGTLKVIRESGSLGLGEVLDLEPAGSASAWVMGRTGFGRMTLRNANDSAYDWIATHPAIPGLSSFAGAREEAGGRIFVTARAGNRTIALRVEGKHTSVLASVTGEKSKLWPGTDGRIWKTDGSSLGYVEGTQYSDLPPSAELAGRILDVLPESSGGFWLATSQKLAHYTPPLWREPVGAPHLTSLVNSIAEDADGRLWFAADTKLLVNDHETWREYPLPSSEVYRAADAKALCPLEDGTILVDVDSSDHRLIFDPRTGTFRKIARGGGLSFGLILPRRAGGLWVDSYPPESHTSKLEILQDGAYRPVPGAERLPMAEVRDLLEARNGDIWIGSTSYLARLARGKLRILTPADGFMDSGAYSFFEAPDGSIFIGGRQGVTIWNGKTFGPMRKDVDRARSFASTQDGNTWAATGSGVHRYRHGQWIENSTDEGLPGAGYKVFCDSTGRLWAGTTFGLRLYHSEADQDAPRTTISEERNLRRAPPTGDVKLNFAAVDKWNTTSPERLLFSWSLDRGAWTSFKSDSFASFRSLSTGDHDFHVRAMDRNGNIDPHPASFKFSVLRQWYLEPLFLLLLAIAASAVGALVRLALQRHARLRFESRHDPLTGLFNRAAFESALESSLEDAATRSGTLSVMFIDLDGFKRVNDTLGHRAGDLLLVAVSARIDAALREAGVTSVTDSRKLPAVARLGGDEFSILLPYGDAGIAEKLAARILEAVRGCDSIEEQPVQVFLLNRHQSVPSPREGRGNAIAPCGSCHVSGESDVERLLPDVRPRDEPGGFPERRHGAGRSRSA